MTRVLCALTMMSAGALACDVETFEGVEGEASVDDPILYDVAGSPITSGNGLPGNGLPMNGLPMNGLPGNGLPMNGLPMNGLPMNGLSPGAFQTTNFKNWFHWFQGCTSTDGCSTTVANGSTGLGTAASRAAAATTMKYIVQCACGPNDSLSFTDRAGANYTWQGRLDLAPNWCATGGAAAFSGGSVAIPDYPAGAVGTNVTVSGQASSAAVKVSFNISHTYRGDLRVTLRAPNGSSYNLWSTSGDGAWDIVQSNVDVTWLAGGAPNGTWRLEVQDYASADVGTLDSWSLAVGTGQAAYAASTADEEWVSACLLASINRLGSTQGGLQVSMGSRNAEQPQMDRQPVEFTSFNFAAQSYAAFYGNFFGSPTAGVKGRYVAAGQHVSQAHNSFGALGRDCQVDGCGSMAVAGFSRGVEGGFNPDSHGHTIPQTVKCSGDGYDDGTLRTCTDTSNRTWNRVITAYSPPTSFFDCVTSGKCTSNSACTSDAAGVACAGSRSAKLAATGGEVVAFQGLTSTGVLHRFRVRYRSTASAAVTLHYTNSVANLQLASFTLPSTGGNWGWYDVGFATPPFTAQYCGGEVPGWCWSKWYLRSAATSAVNAELNLSIDEIAQ